MLEIPAKCVHWKVANSALSRWWCLAVCGRTNGRLCDWWCRIAERYGMWTLILTLGVPNGLIVWVLMRI